MRVRVGVRVRVRVVQSLLEPGYRQTGWDSPTSRSQGVLRVEVRVRVKVKVRAIGL